MQEVVRVGVGLPVQSIWHCDRLVDGEVVRCVERALRGARRADHDGHAGVGVCVDEVRGRGRHETGQVRVGAVYGCGESGAGVVEGPDFDEGDLRGQRRVDV